MAPELAALRDQLCDQFEVACKAVKAGGPRRGSRSTMSADSEPTSTPPSPALLEEIDAVCDRFEAELRAGRQPLIEDYLEKVAGRARPELLRELLPLEIFYRL